MIVGNGLLATAFNKYKTNLNVTIFASGVSNSKETKDSEYKRELDLIFNEISKLKNEQLLIYFSTISVYDESLKDSNYIKHKLYIENYISNYCDKFIIFRLPNVISNSKNPFTLVNFLSNCIKNRIKFELHSKACRYLIDIDDVVSICSKIIDNYFGNGIYDVILNNPIRVLDIVKIIEGIFQIEAVFETIEKGSCYEVPQSVRIPKNNYTQEDLSTYIYLSIKKYIK